MYYAKAPLMIGREMRTAGEALPEVYSWDESVIWSHLISRRIEFRDERGVFPFRGPAPSPVGERPGARASLPQQPPAASRKRDRGAA